MLALCLLTAPASDAVAAATRAHAESWSLLASPVRTAAVRRATCLPPSCPTTPEAAPANCPGATRVVMAKGMVPSMGPYLIETGLLGGPKARLPAGAPGTGPSFRLVEAHGVRQWAWAQKIGWDMPPGARDFTVRGWDLRTGAPIWWQLTPGATRVTTLGILRVHWPHVLAPHLLYVTAAGCYRLVVHYPGGVRSGVLAIDVG